MVASDSLRRVTLAELVATLSLMADLGMGRPMERALRQTVVAMRLGAAAGMDGAACASAYYTSLLTWVGCAVDTSEVAALFGDEMEFYAETRDEDLGGGSPWRSSLPVISAQAPTPPPWPTTSTPSSAASTDHDPPGAGPVPVEVLTICPDRPVSQAASSLRIISDRRRAGYDRDRWSWQAHSAHWSS